MATTKPIEHRVAADALIFERHDAYYAWRNVMPATGDVTITELERQVVTDYINELEATLSNALERSPAGFDRKTIWPWQTIDR